MDVETKNRLVAIVSIIGAIALAILIRLTKWYTL